MSSTRYALVHATLHKRPVDFTDPAADGFDWNTVSNSLLRPVYVHSRSGYAYRANLHLLRTGLKMRMLKCWRPTVHVPKNYWRT